MKVIRLILRERRERERENERERERERKKEREKESSGPLWHDPHMGAGGSAGKRKPKLTAQTRTHRLPR